MTRKPAGWRRGQWPGRGGSCRAGRTEEESVLALGDEARGGEVVNEGAVHLLVEVEVEAVQGAIAISEAGLFGAAFENAYSADRERRFRDRDQRFR
jgi:hypothetical protein